MKGWGTGIGGSEGGGGALGTRAPLGVISFITGRNEVVAKVMFLHVSVILSRGGGSPAERPPPAGRPPPRDQADPTLRLGEPPPVAGRPPPPGPGRPPPGLGEPPQDQADPPGWETTPPQADPPPGWETTPPGTRQTPPGKQTSEYGPRAAGTHPTGMHSCFYVVVFVKKNCQIIVFAQN